MRKDLVKGIDYPKFMNDESLDMLHNGYLLEGETPAQAITRASKTAADILYDMAAQKNTNLSDLPDLQQKFEEMIWNNNFCMSSPMWANLGTERGLPISCYGSYVEDSIAGISYAYAEVMNMSAMGGGTSATFSPIRGKGEKVSSIGHSRGVPFFLEEFDRMIQKTDQGKVRKGAFSASFSIDHKDFYDLITIRDKHSKIQRMTFAVEVDDEFIVRLRAQEDEAVNRWLLVLKSRSEKGLPYIFFKGNANRQKPACYANSEIEHTNLCTEIMLPNNADESFVCCVASMNAMTFDAWGDSIFYGTLFMEAVMQDFINKLKKSNLALNSMSRALRFAERHRALAMGVLGYHSYLQSQMIPFDSQEAMMINGRIFSLLNRETKRASRYLAEKFGETEMTAGTGLRHTTNLGVAPTTSNASISGGWSPQTEPSMSNMYTVKLAKGKFIRKNVFLEKVIDGKNLPEQEKNDIWTKIMLSGGSCQDIACLTDHEKEVFRTFSETNQYSIINQAAQRQVYIDQGQSINLNFPSTTPVKTINALILHAYDSGIKSLYYQRSASVLREELSVLNDTSCKACEG